MSKTEWYEQMDLVIEKERNAKTTDNKKEDGENNLRGGSGFVCGIECKTCGNG